MEVKVFNCRSRALEEEINRWLATLPAEPIIVRTDITNEPPEFVTYVVLYKFDING